MRSLTLTLCIIISFMQEVSCNDTTRAQGAMALMAAITPPPSIRGIDWRRQVQEETCGFECEPSPKTQRRSDLTSSFVVTAPANFVTCDQGATCATSWATTEGITSIRTILYIGCCRYGIVCNSLLTSCADLTDVPRQKTVDSNVLTW